MTINIDLKSGDWEATEKIVEKGERVRTKYISKRSGLIVTNEVFNKYEDQEEPASRFTINVDLEITESLFNIEAFLAEIQEYEMASEVKTLRKSLEKQLNLGDQQ